MSPRRSSRARTNPSQQQPNSSSSSISSGRADNSARPNPKITSPRSSAATRSLSSEEIEGSAKPQPRRTRSSQEESKEIPAHHDDEEDEEGEEEVTRCICGNLDYPGMPSLAGGVTKSDPRNTSGPGFAVSASMLPEDAGGLFIQCDVCKVWQHGGCVGIMDEAMSPEEYFCEQCRKELHKIKLSTNGQRYSQYLPVQGSPSSQSSPTPPTQENPSKKSKDGRSSRANAEAQTGKRRATMNSRDSAYEAEQLRRAIEESKREVPGASTDAGARRGKRSRSDSEQHKEDTKRQRTASSSSPSDNKPVGTDAGSADEDDTAPKNGQPKIRGAAARNHRNKELREQEEKREQERAEAAAKRKARSERRRADDSEPSPEPPAPRATSNSKNLNAENPLPSFATPTPPLPKPSHKKTGRPPAKRGRVGRNQYTRDRAPPHSTTANVEHNTSPGNSNGSNGDDGTPHINGTNSPSNHPKNGTENGSKSRLKHLNPSRTTMNDMKRRVAAILEFISHTQVEMATSEHSRTSQSTTITPPDSGSSKDSAGGSMVEKLLEGSQAMLEDLDSEGFGKLSSVEMMEVLTRRLMRWQVEYGKWGDK